MIAAEVPDIVLSDIRMPKMDGLELMEYISRDYPHIRMVILSGYNDFEYLQSSIKNGVCEYLLKPTDIDEFESVFRKMHERLDEDKKRERLFKEGERLKAQKQFDACLRGYGYDEEELEREFYDAEEGRFGVMYFHITGVNWQDKREQYLQGTKITEVLEEIRCEKKLFGKFFLNYEDQITGVLMLPEDQEEEKLKEYAEYMLNSIKERMGISVSVGISNFYLDYQMLPQCYQQAKCCGSQQIFSEKNHLIMYYREMAAADFNYYTISFDTDKIMEYILEQNNDKLLEELERTFSIFRNRVIPDYDYINRLSLELMFNISRKLLRSSVQLEKVMEKMGYTYSDVYIAEDLADKRDFLYRIFASASGECQAMRGETRKRSNLASAIRELVDSEFDSNRMSLEYIAGKVNKNTAYISKIFKKEFECNFSVYVTQKRLEKSLELLKDPSLKVYEISEVLGWADVSNYIKSFRKKYGMSPNEYRSMGEDNKKPGA